MFTFAFLPQLVFVNTYILEFFADYAVSFKNDGKHFSYFFNIIPVLIQHYDFVQLKLSVTCFIIFSDT